MITHNNPGRLLSVLLMAAALCAPSAFGATALTTTTLSVAIPAAPQTNQQVVTSITVASATGIVAQPTQQQAQGGLGGPFAGSVATFLYVDRELMSVNSINGTIISVGRGVQGTPATAHNSGATVYVATGNQLVASASRVTGYCNSAIQPSVTPFIDPLTGLEYGCPSVGPYTNNWTITGMTSPAGSYTPSDNTLPGTSVSFVCHAHFDVTVDSGSAFGLFTPSVGCTIPKYALIYKVVIDNVTAFAGNTGDNLSVGLSAGGAGAAALLGAVARSTLSGGVIYDGVPVAGASASATNATYIKMSAAGNVTVTISTAAASAGTLDIDVFYYVLQA